MRIRGMRGFAATVVIVSLLAACGASPGSGRVSPPSDANAAPSPAKSPPAAGSTASGTTGNAPPASGAARAAFLSYAFTDVRDGKQFTVADFQGKQVLVIGMAVW